MPVISNQYWLGYFISQDDWKITKGNWGADIQTLIIYSKINIITIKGQTLTIPSDSDEMGEFKEHCDWLNYYYDSCTKLQNYLLKCFVQLNDSEQLVMIVNII